MKKATKTQQNQRNEAAPTVQELLVLLAEKNQKIEEQDRQLEEKETLLNAQQKHLGDKEKLINEARRDYNKVIPLAEGEKDQRIREADGYRLKRINEAEGDVARFNALLAEYRKAPEVTRRRIYLETLQEVMPSIQSKIIVDEQTQGILPLLNLGIQKAGQP